MTYSDVYAREVHGMGREQLLRSLLRERYGWAPRHPEMTDEDDMDDDESEAA